MANAAVAAIQFALETDEGMAFLRCWNESDFDSIKREWPEAPEEVFIGADPFYIGHSKSPDAIVHVQQTLADFEAKAE